MLSGNVSAAKRVLPTGLRYQCPRAPVAAFRRFARSAPRGAAAKRLSRTDVLWRSSRSQHTRPARRCAPRGFPRFKTVQLPGSEHLQNGNAGPAGSQIRIYRVKIGPPGGIEAKHIGLSSGAVVKQNLIASVGNKAAGDHDIPGRQPTIVARIQIDLLSHIVEPDDVGVAGGAVIKNDLAAAVADESARCD